MSNKMFEIRPFEMEDAENLCELMVSNQIHFKEYLPKTLAQNLTVENSKIYIAEKQTEIALNTGFTFGIVENHSNKIAGIIILKKLDWKKNQGELAYCIDNKYTGKGWMSQAVEEISEFAFNELGLRSLQIITHKSNMASCKVAEKNNFIWKRTLENEFIPTTGIPIDMELYELKR